MKFKIKTPFFKLAVLSFLYTAIVCLMLPVGRGVADSSQTLRLGLLPIPDSLPVYVAEAQGYFKECGVTVEALPVGSAMERDQLMQAGRIDGMVNEMAGTANFNREKTQMKVIAIARTPKGDSPLFRILAAPESGIKTPEDLKNIPIAVSKNTIIEYITDRMLTAKGLTDSEISKKSVPVLPERLQLLLAGRIKAATLPDPLAKSAMEAGATVILDDTITPEYSASVVSFSTKALGEKSKAVKGFMKAWSMAASDLNSNPEKFRKLMLKKIRVPGNVRETFRIPPFPINEVPSRDQWNDMMEWMKNKKLISAIPAYESSVTEKFLAR